jgi:transposase-like protein
MRIYFTPDDTLHVCPETDVEAMALKYWRKEFMEHGLKVLEIHTEPVINLPAA